MKKDIYIILFLGWTIISLSILLVIMLVIEKANAEQVQITAEVPLTAENCRTTCYQKCLNKFK
jgi:hypothetical protein